MSRRIACVTHTLNELLVKRAEYAPDFKGFTHLLDGESREVTLTYSDLFRRAAAIAARMQDAGAAGERAFIPAPGGLDFIVGFFAALLAGAIAVPVPAPRGGRRQLSHDALLRDADPKFLLGSSAAIGEATATGVSFSHAFAVDSADPNDSALWRPPPIGPSTIAYLQYTSGSTSAPRGVILTHDNVLTNLEMISAAFAAESGPSVSWLPTYHDMGLIAAVLRPLYEAAASVSMSPLAFVQRPLRWISAISRHGAVCSGGPNFGYDLCVRKIAREQVPDLDLSSWRIAFCGSEPVRAETLLRFSSHFKAAGFRYSAFFPCYGLAEATVFATGDEAGPHVLCRDARGLEANASVPPRPDANARTLVGCGKTWNGLKLAIVDPVTHQRLPDGTVGEIWISGPNVSEGYWRKPAESGRCFRAKIAGEENAFYLRTGDLGFLEDGQLFITGRCKDLIIVDGRNIHPQDIEETVLSCSGALSSWGIAAFALDNGLGEQVAIAAEFKVRDGGDSASAAEVLDAIRNRVSRSHGVPVAAVVLTPPGAIPKTTSGKVQRGRCRALLASGELPVLAGWRITTGAEKSTDTLATARAHPHDRIGAA